MAGRRVNLGRCCDGGPIVTAASSRWLGLLFLAASIVLSAVGQLCMKVGMQELHGISQLPAYDLSVGTMAALRIPIAWTAAGLAAYACSLLSWLAVLVRHALSFAYPLLSLSYVLVYVGATHWPRLAETATPLRTLGTLLILVGVGLVMRVESPKERPIG